MKTIPSLHLRMLALVCVGSMLGAIPARSGSYYMQKSFSFQPPAAAGISVRSITYCHAFTTDQPRSGPVCIDFEVEPPTQPGNWRPYEHDVMAGYGSITVKNWGTNDDGTSTFIVANTNYTSFASLGGVAAFDAVADDCPSTAQANSEISVDSFIGTNLITGEATVFGTNTVIEQTSRHSAYAFSTAMVEVQGTNMVKGVATAGPVFRTKLRGVKGHDGRSVKDPVTFRVHNLATGEVTTGELFHFILEGLPGQGGEVSWESNVMHMAASDCSFRLELPGVYTTERGRMQMEVRQGVLMKAESDGIYAGILPLPGTSVPFDLPLPNLVRLTYDLTGIAGTNAEVAIELSVAGQVLEVFEADEPALLVTTTPEAVTLAWPVSATPFQLQKSPEITPGPLWADTGLKPIVEEGSARVTLPLEPGGQFFRLFAEETGPCDLFVVSQPEDTVGGVGATVVWNVEASGEPAPNSFQWQRLDREGAFVDIPGANTPLLTWTAGPADQNAQFRCNIANGCSAVTSLPARVIFLAD